MVELRCQCIFTTVSFSPANFSCINGRGKLVFKKEFFAEASFLNAVYALEGFHWFFFDVSISFYFLDFFPL